MPKYIIASGIGFSPSTVSYIVTRGLSVNAAPPSSFLINNYILLRLV